MLPFRSLSTSPSIKRSIYETDSFLGVACGKMRANSCANGYAARPRFGKIDPDSLARPERVPDGRPNNPRDENQEKNGPDVATVDPFEQVK